MFASAECLVVHLQTVVDAFQAGAQTFFTERIEALKR
jgi:hypothetical protein